MEPGIKQLLGRVPVAALCRRFWPAILFFLLFAVDVTIRFKGEGHQVSLLWTPYVAGVALRVLLCFLAPIVLLRRWAHCALSAAFAWMMLILSVELTAWGRFGVTIKGEVFAILMGSSAQEVRAFLSALFDWRIVLMVLALLPALFFGCRALCRYRLPYPARRCTSVMIAALLLEASLLLGFTTKDALSFAFPLDSCTQIGRYRRLARLVREPDVSTVARTDRPLPVLVVVIGESATRDHWQLYGYPRETTPLLAARQDELLVYTDVLAAWAHTQEALTMFLTRSTMANEDPGKATMPQMLTAAGYRCVLLSAQPHWGVFDSIDTLLFTGCEKRYLEEIEPDAKGYDERLLPLLENLLQEPSPQPLVVFVHLYGSHCAYSDRYPPQEAHFTAEQKHADPNGIDAYDDSIRYTDKVLDGLIDVLAKDNRASLLFYFSDHGETPDARSIRKQTERSLWRIPMVFWGSPVYKAENADRWSRLAALRARPLQGDRLTGGVLDLLDVKSDGDGLESFLSETFDWTRERKVENGKKAVGPGW